MSNPDLHVAIIGGGPSGLLTAHYLREQGYEHVYVLERLGRLGGLCKTITVDGHAFDLGANYVVPSYHEIRRLAKRFDMELYVERPMVAMNLPENENGRVHTEPMVSALMKTESGERIPLLRFGGALLRYCWKRWRLRSVIDRPTFEGVADFDGGSLAKPIGEWLVDEELTDLDRVFDLPVAMMGYGDSRHTPAIYTLKFMTIMAFVPMVVRQAPVIGRFVPWPKRFVHGYQRFFERMSWDLNVRTDVEITHIERDRDGIRIDYRAPEQDLAETREAEHSLHVDRLVLACPLEQFTKPDSPLALQDEERALLEEIDCVSYCMTTRTLTFADDVVEGRAPLSPIYPLPAYVADSPVPFGVAKQWADTPFAQFYTSTRRPDGRSFEEVETAVTSGVDRFVRQLGGIAVLDEEDTSRTFNRWLYFQHVDEDPIRRGWYDRLERQQGRNDTYFVGGATNFELIEPIAAYAKNLVAEHFPVLPRPVPIPWARIGRITLVLVLLMALVRCAITPAPDSIPFDYPLGDGAAREASVAFWEAFQAPRLAELSPAACEADPDGDADGSLICRLRAAEVAEAEDDTVPLLLAGAYLWRVQSGAWPESSEADLRIAAEHSARAAALGNAYAPGFQASAEWLLAILTDDTELGEEAAALMRANTHAWAAFQGFIEMEQLSTRLPPEHGRDGVTFAMAEDAYEYMLAACLLGDWTPDWARMPASVPINDFVVNTALAFIAVFGERECYNTPPAPYGVPGNYLVSGDMYLKAGDLDTAIALYRNAARSPAFEHWDYRELVDARMRDLGAYQQQFLADSGRVLGSDPARAMAGQSAYYCIMCHARSGSPR